MVNIKRIECLCLGTVGQIVAPWKFDVLKTRIFALEAFRVNIYVKKPIVPRPYKNTP